ncbi:putative deuterolysin [Microsporum canis]|uniref:Probable neutral protease 2 homolog MCYG_05201 n=1 Tax=Arthroderma otae (strain ATCC MYA-4605 / CBS 113480) TaxID=554155 RepID=NPIIA_ARTOC|nr:metalloproteinase [Microsporum canis CBS 113480]C5FR79.1 RecName: Full=Probable neutral protease 2 homolog MCYG_05201; AltName: Full=Deuterolysin MCYG_05201; Flags: Precursor [Microsporum canis CBS 113480]EEQ32382.1 metalloproteinase [Microsporum canis CBS 113480]
MQFFTALAAVGALVAPALALPTQVPANQSLIDVQLSATGNSMIKAVITNKGTRALNLLKFNTIMDENPTAKVMVFDKNGAEVEFTGMLPRYDMNSLSTDYFATLAPQASVEHSFDIAATHNIKESGKYTLSAHGLIPTAEEHGTTITGQAFYESNTLEMEIDASKAAMVPRAFEELDAHIVGTIDKRSGIVTSSCDASQLRIVKQALANSRMLALNAARAASSNPSKVREYFGSSDSSIMQKVASRFQSVARESTASGGQTTYHCTDNRGSCKPGVLAYTLPSTNTVYNCPSYYREPSLTKRCHAQDQATTTLHELTHNPVVVSPFCKDLGYGYRLATGLPTSKAIQNADNYALFANEESSPVFFVPVFYSNG